MAEIAQQIRLWRRSIIDFAEAQVAYIQTKQTEKHASQLKPIDIDHYPNQRLFLQKIQKRRDENRPVRIVVLKPRQTGQTTISDLVMFHATAFFKNVNTIIASYEADSAQEIHAKNEIFYEMLDACYRPMLDRSSRREMLFRNPSRKDRPKKPGLRSRIYVETAGKVELGRSKQIQNFLGSEVAFWGTGEDNAVAVMNCVPYAPNTTVILESTANGIGGFFYNKWKEAERGESDWMTFFFPWFDHPEYVYEPDEKFNAQNLDEEEEMLVDAHGITPAQIAWRRMKIANDFGDSPAKFPQEYPSTPDEAFVVSGNPAFSRLGLKFQMDFCVKKGVPMILEETARPEGYGRPSIFARQVPTSEFTVWDPPKQGHVYVVAGDVSQGLPDGDYDAGGVVDCATLEQVAEVHGKMSTEEFADWLVLMAWWYNRALLSVEKNRDGIDVLRRAMGRYSNLYHEEVWDDQARQKKRRVGWRMSDVNKPLVIAGLRTAIKNRSTAIRSAALIDECITLQRDDRGRFAAKKGKYDDRVDYYAVALFIARSIPMVEEVASSQMISRTQVRMSLPDRVVAYDQAKLAETPDYML